MEKDTSVIPRGDYCYTPIGHNGVKMQVKYCPYWSLSKGHEKQNNGYCSYLEKGDWDLNKEKSWESASDVGNFLSASEIGLPMSLLWDAVKECGINHYDDDEIFSDILDNIKDLEPEFSETVDRNFWKLI